MQSDSNPRKDRKGWVSDLAGPGILACGTLLFFLLRYPARSFGLPMGPDGPVYLWWARLGSVDGLQIANWRPGVPALSLVLGQTLHLSQVQVLAAFGGVLAAVAALSAASLVETARPALAFHRRTALLAGLLAGAFAVNLAGGYFGNLVFAALFIAAAAVIAATKDKKGVAAAAVLLAGGGLAHPMFFLAGTGILLITALALRREEPAQARRTAFAAAGGAAVVGAGMLSMLAGARPLAVDTSADAFLRRAGLTESLAAEYRSRLTHHLARYVLWLSVPLAFLGRKAASGFVRQFLRVWIYVTAAGLVAALVSNAIPGLRTLSFAFALPILAALGLSRAWGRYRPPVAAAIVVALAGIMIFGSALTWFREKPYMTTDQVSQVTDAVAQAGGISDPGTPIVFVVDENNPALVSFHVTDWGNVIRATVPTDRIRDVYLYVGTASNAAALKPTLNGDPQHDALSELYLKDLISGLNARPPAVMCVLPAFNPPGRQETSVADCAPTRPTPDPASLTAGTVTAPVASWTIVTSGFAVFLFLALVGLGWAAGLAGGKNANRFVVTALSPAFGAATLTLTAIAADRLGLRLASTATSTGIAAFVALSGYACAWLRRRGNAGSSAGGIDEQAVAGTEPSPEVD